MKYLKILAAGVVVLLVLALVANLVYGWRLRGSLELRLAALRAAGEPTSFAELALERDRLERNAAAILEQAQADIDAFGGDYVAFFNKYDGEKFDRLRPTSEQLTEIGEILARYPSLPQQLETAAACDGYASQIDFSVKYPQMMDELLRPAQHTRMAVRFLRWQIAVQLAEGKPEDAVRTGLAILRLARLYEAEPGFVNGLVAIAISGTAIDGLHTAIRSGPISIELLQQLDKELNRRDDPKRLTRAMKSERAIGLTMSHEMFAQAWWMPWIARGMQLDMLDYYDQLLPLVVRPWYEFHEQSRRIDIGARTMFSGPILQDLLPTLQATLDAYSRDLVSCRALRILGAISRFRLLTGQEPTSLESLELPKTAQVDPFSGKRLKLKSTLNGWVIYSVFKDGIDNGGEFQEMADWGLAPLGYSGE